MDSVRVFKALHPVLGALRMRLEVSGGGGFPHLVTLTTILALGP